MRALIKTIPGLNSRDEVWLAGNFDAIWTTVDPDESGETQWHALAVCAVRHGMAWYLGVKNAGSTAAMTHGSNVCCNDNRLDYCAEEASVAVVWCVKRTALHCRRRLSCTVCDASDSPVGTTVSSGIRAEGRGNDPTM